MWWILTTSAGWALDCAPHEGAPRVQVIEGPLEVGDTVRVRVDGGVTVATSVVGELSGRRTTYRAEAQLEPPSTERIRVGCEPLPGDPHSCSDPFLTVNRGGEGAVLSLGPIQKAGRYSLVVCGTNHGVGDLRTSLDVAEGPFARFPRLPGRTMLERAVFRQYGDRYQARYGTSQPDIDVIWARMSAAEEAARALAAIRIRGVPVPGMPVDVRVDGAIMRAGWTTEGSAFVYVEATAIDGRAMRSVLDRLLDTWAQ